MKYKIKGQSETTYSFSKGKLCVHLSPPPRPYVGGSIGGTHLMETVIGMELKHKIKLKYEHRNTKCTRNFLSWKELITFTCKITHMISSRKGQAKTFRISGFVQLAIPKMQNNSNW